VRDNLALVRVSQLVKLTVLEVSAFVGGRVLFVQKVTLSLLRCEKYLE
jgi:hypothetical protein